MPAKKATPGKVTPSKSKRKHSFPCPNPSKPVSLRQLIVHMRKDRDFADFIRELLCDSYSTDQAKAEAAKNCLASYYRLTKDDLEELCIPGSFLKNASRCTVPGQNLLLAVPAKVLSEEATGAAQR